MRLAQLIKEAQDNIKVRELEEERRIQEQREELQLMATKRAYEILIPMFAEIWYEIGKWIDTCEFVDSWVYVNFNPKKESNILPFRLKIDPQGHIAIDRQNGFMQKVWIDSISDFAEILAKEFMGYL